MSDEVIIISPELQEGAGGLADYTLRVVEAWRDLWPVRFLVPAGANVSSPSVEQIERSAEALRQRLPAHGGKVLLQYSAYGFDRHGYPRWLLRALVDWRKRSGGLLVVMFHEIWTFWPVLNKNYLVQELHRRDIGRLVRQADAIFTSTASQAKHLRGLAREREIRFLPVGSNIRVHPAKSVAREAGLAILFGLEAARVRTLQQVHDHLKELARAGKITRVVTLGGGKSGKAIERTLLSDLSLANGFAQRGALPEPEISTALSASTFGISDQDELSLMKSGTFMAYAAHGLNILSPIADPLVAEPLCWLTSPAELRHGISTDQLNARAANLRGWQEHTSSWPRIGDEFARALQLPAVTKA